MTFAICTVSVMPVRLASDDRTEMVTQALFGEFLEVLEMSANWAYVRLCHDHYMGWVDTKQFTIISEEEMQLLKQSKMYYSADILQVVVESNSQEMIPVVLGSHLPAFNNNKLSFGDKVYQYEGNTLCSDVEPKRGEILKIAREYINAPYLWGGKNPLGIDCSGFTQTVYKLCGITIARDASMQAEQGDVVNFITDAMVGDLAFFDNNDGKIIHVGILIGDNKIIHASGKVRIDSIDHQGIFNLESGKYTHKLRVIKSYFS